MKKALLSATVILVAILLFILFTSQMSPTGKFYYAFNEKIFIDEIPNKYVVKFKDKQKATDNKSFLAEKAGGEQQIKFQNESTFTIDLSGTGKSITILDEKKSDIELIKPAYKFQKQEMYYTDEILVEPVEGISIEEIIQKNNLTADVKITKGKFYHVIKVADTQDACEIANKIQESGMVKYSHPNFMMPAVKNQVIPNDTYFNNQYYLRNTGQIFNPVENHSGTANADINAPFAWVKTLGNNAIVVAVIDEGVTSNHPDLPNTRQVRLNGSNFVPGENVNDPTPGLNNDHGNASSGIIAATQNNNEGVSGIAPNVRIMPIKVFGQNGNADDNGFAAAIDFAWQNGAHIISNSWGYSVDNPNLIPAIVTAINRAVTLGRGGLGSVVVFAAGNTANHSLGNNGIIQFPSNVQINGVLTVGASDRSDLQADYSPTSNAASPNNQIIDIVAPSHRAYPAAWGGIAGEGFEIWSIDIPGNNGYNQWNDPFGPGFPGTAPAFGEVLPTTGTNNLSYTGRMGGTSAACPQVAAVAALLLSLNNNLTQQQVFDIITQSAEKVGGYTYNTNGWSSALGNGRLNACAAIGSIPNQYPISGPPRLCTTANYTVPGLPPGSTISWASSNTSIATISPSGLATRVNNIVDVNVTFTATINAGSRCGTAVSTITIESGAAVNIQMTNRGCNGQYQIWELTASPASNGSNWNWYVSYLGNNSQITIYNPSSPSTLVSVKGGGVIGLTYTNACGDSRQTGITVYSSCYGGYGYRLAVSPNPAKDNMNVGIVKQDQNATSSAESTSNMPLIQIESKGKTIISLVDLYTKSLIRQWKQNETANSNYNLNISGLRKGIYVLQVDRDNQTMLTKVMIE